ncbi:hypothetical protein BG842_02195 [Haladaptatus sp. W1]|nr:hypothetical protein BG842_02195 [Haladaptatus sp. W1]
MTGGHQKRCDETSTHQETDSYAVVVATKQEGIDVVLHGLSASQAERIAARKNREMDGDSSVHAVSEKQIQEAHENLHRIITS